MSAMGDLVHLLITSGLLPEQIAHVIDLAQQHAVEQISVYRIPPDVHPTSAHDRRKTYDRDRKRLQRGLRLPESEWIPLVAKILERDGGTCTYCDSKEKLTADHVVPLTRGGTNDTSNLTACCLPCNTKKSNKFISEWLPNSSVKFHADVHPNPPDTENVDILTSLSSSSLLSEETLKKERKKESSGIRARDASTVPDDWPADYGDVFWKAYPRKEEKIAAMKKLATLRKSGIVTFADLMAGVDRYCSVKREPQFIKQPTVWLNKGCWADETQTGSRNGERSGNTRSSGHDAIFAAFARKAGEIPGDSPVAGAASEDEFPIRDGINRGAKGGPTVASTSSARAYNGRASFGFGVLEGEIIPPDKPPIGVPGSREQH